MYIFLKYSTVSKTTKSKTVIRIFYETAKDKRFFALVSQKVLSSSSLCPPSASLVYGKWKMPPLRRSAIARAFTSAVQFKMHAPTTLPPWQVPWGSEMADGFLQTTKPTTIIILAERSNLLFTRSGATASSLPIEKTTFIGFCFFTYVFL